MTTLTDFLLARIDEDAEVAEVAAAEFVGPGQWAARDNGDVIPALPGGILRFGEVAVGPGYSDGIGLAGVHIARHDPDRVMAECAAKRRIVELHNRRHECCILQHDSDEPNTGAYVDAARCSTLRLLALPYSDHPDYQQEWKP